MNAPENIAKIPSTAWPTSPLAKQAASTFDQLDLSLGDRLGTDLTVFSPIDGSQLAALRMDTPGDVDAMVANARTAFAAWKLVPAPHRGELVRR